MTYPGILPNTRDALTAPFWAAAKEHRLVAQRCTACGSFRWPPAELCHECLASGPEWAPLAGTATVWSSVVYHRAMHPAFTELVPYTLAMLELPEGIRMLGTVTSLDGAGAGEVGIGATVSATYDDVTEDVTLIRWRVMQSRMESE